MPFNDLRLRLQTLQLTALLADAFPLTPEQTQLLQAALLEFRLPWPVIRRNRRLRRILDCLEERWDGTGRPHGLIGDEIPWETRLLQILFAVERALYALDGVRQGDVRLLRFELENAAGTRFDPNLSRRVGVFLQKHAARFQTIARQPLRQLFSLLTTSVPLNDAVCDIKALTSFMAQVDDADDAALLLAGAGRLLASHLAAEVTLEHGTLRYATAPEERRALRRDWQACEQPLMLQRKETGRIVVRVPAGQAFSSEDRELLQAFAGMLALALARRQTPLPPAASRHVPVPPGAGTDDVRYLLDQLPLSVALFDAAGKPLFFNRSLVLAFERLGIDRNAMQRLPLARWLEANPRWSDAWRRLAAGQSVWDQAWHIDGRFRREVYYVRVTPLPDARGAPAGFMLMADLRTALTRLTEHINQLEQLAQVGELAASAVHEIRNPLTVIKGYLQLMTAQTTEQQEQIRLINQEIGYLESLVNDLLDLAKPLHPRPEPFQLNDLIYGLTAMIAPRTQRQQVDVLLKLDHTLPELHADARQLHQLLLNLIDNALDAMPDGGMLRIETASQRRLQRPQLLIRISDTGIGIDPEQQARLFEPFFSTKPHGTGLGLLVVRGIVSKHGGQIRVDSEPGKGTTVSVTLPL